MSRAILQSALRQQHQLLLTLNNSPVVRITLVAGVDLLLTHSAALEQLAQKHQAILADIADAQSGRIDLLLPNVQAADRLLQDAEEDKIHHFDGVRPQVERAESPFSWSSERSLELERPHARIWFRTTLNPHSDVFDPDPFLQNDGEMLELWAGVVGNLSSSSEGFLVDNNWKPPSIASCTVQVRVKGATKIVDEGVLRPFFAGLGTVKHVVVLGQKNFRTAYVTLSSKVEAARAIQFSNAFELKGGKVEIKLSTSDRQKWEGYDAERSAPPNRSAPPPPSSSASHLPSFTPSGYQPHPPEDNSPPSLSLAERPFPSTSKRTFTTSPPPSNPYSRTTASSAQPFSSSSWNPAPPASTSRWTPMTNYSNNASGSAGWGDTYGGGSAGYGGGSTGYGGGGGGGDGRAGGSGEAERGDGGDGKGKKGGKKQPLSTGYLGGKSSRGGWADAYGRGGNGYMRGHDYYGGGDWRDRG